MAYATLSDVRAYLGLQTTETKDDTLLQALLERAQKMIEERTHRVFEAAADSTRYFDAVGDVEGQTLYLDEDLCAITSITNGDGVAVSSSEYVTDPRNETPWYAIRLKVSSSKVWTYQTDPEKAISIVGKWAYSTSAPKDVVQATIRLAAWLYRQRGSSSDIDRPMVTGEGVTILPSALPKDIQDVIETRRRHPYHP
jgi:hypothetical protein